MPTVLVLVETEDNNNNELRRNFTSAVFLA